MTASKTIFALALAAVTAASACTTDEAESTGQGAGGGGGGATIPEPMNHRATAEMCTGTPPAGNPIPMHTESQCEADSECTAGDNGRCVWPYAGGNRCMYDECNVDADCGGASVCDCRGAFGFNHCFQGNCQTDEDCDGSYCSPSTVTFGPTCMTGISPGSVGFFCRTAQDECNDDSDCGAPETGACIFSVESLAWVCHELLCAN